MEDRQYMSYGVGLSFEYPLGNRSREAELMRRRLERRKAVSILHTAADQVAVQVKEKARKSQTTLEQVSVQKDASEAARAQLEALEESEPIREKLTPEFLLVKLQAQETYAQTRRAQVNALTEFNISLMELARTTGTVLQLHRVETALTTATRSEPEETPEEPRKARNLPDVMPSGLVVPQTPVHRADPASTTGTSPSEPAEPRRERNLPDVTPSGLVVPQVR